MLGVFEKVKAIAPVQRKLREPHTEGVANRLHYRATVVFLMGCSLLVTCLEWVGNGRRIACVLEGSEDDWVIASNVINTYCYVLTTFTLPKHWGSTIGEQASQTGVGAYDPSRDRVTHKAYYQWVPFVLFLQGCFFYAPHMIFKAWEGGKVRGIISGLHNYVLDRGDRKSRERTLAEYFADALGTHNFWALKQLFVEFLNLVNVVANIYFVDIFLGGEFSTYGSDVVRFLDADPETRIDPMAVVFPRVTKCTFTKYGPSGTVQTHDAICVLPINIVNEKIYVVMWFWLVVLSALTVVSLLYHIFFMITPAATKMYLGARAMNQRELGLDEIARHCELGDWKLLYLLGRNMEPVVLGEFLRELADVLEERRKTKRRAPSGDYEMNPLIRKNDRNGPTARANTAA